MNGYKHPTAVIYPNVKFGDNVYIGPGCIIGSPAEHKAFWNKDVDYTVVIGDNVVIHGNVTIDAGTERDTVVESGVWLMKGVHIGHDAKIEEGCVLSPHVIIGGHSVIQKNTNMGMGSIVHQRCTVPPGCMIGMNSTVTKKSELLSHGVYVGSPVKLLRWNMKR